ncbi:MAG: S41 family peptidase [Acidiphilium sp.]|nr:S41 family peptidase [Acidiphilium sp.]MDD4935008.1 S41 family peptidase [Acidiphilium sp.]
MKFRTNLLIAGTFVVGIGVGVVAPVVRGALADAPAGGNTYQQLGLFENIFQRVKADYVTPEPSSKLIYDSMNGMLAGLDPHSGYMNKRQYKDMQAETSGQFGGLGLEVSQAAGFIKVISPIDGTPAAKAGIKPGDLIVAINGKPIVGITLDKAVDDMRGPPGSQITLMIKRAGVHKPIVDTLTRATIHVQAVKDKLYGKIGYMRLASFSENANRDIRRAVHKLQSDSHDHVDAYVLDLRNNPGGLLNQGIAVADDFLNSGEIVSTHGRHSADDEVWYAHPGDIAHGKPIVILINSGTASAAEIVAAALQQNRRAVVMGTRSFGKGSVQTIFTIPGHGALRLTTALYYTPSGKSLQDYGVQPDVTVHESSNPKDQFPKIREADMPNAFHNPSGMKAPILPPKLVLPAMVKTIAPRPPATWPKLVPDKASTDYQLQMALKLAAAMARQGGTNQADASH